MKIGVILNPVAGAGKAAALWPAFETALHSRFGAFDLKRTASPEEAVHFATAMAKEGFDLVLAAGGDGTIGDVADGLLTSGYDAAMLPAFAILPCGTGSDLARTLAIDGNPAKIVSLIDPANARLIDAGRVSFVDEAGRAAMRHFINIASFGLSGPTSRAVNAAKRSGNASGQLLFMWHTVRELIRYKFQNVVITVDDAPPLQARIAVVAVANAKYFGGGMKIAPDADPCDGLLDIVIFRGTAKLSLIKDMRLLYSGSHANHPMVTILRGRRIVVDPAGGLGANEAGLDVDGEAPGSIPATFEIVPGALRMCTG
jgi:diacylglycerol kinase (ATP)